MIHWSIFVKQDKNIQQFIFFGLQNNVLRPPKKMGKSMDGHITHRITSNGHPRMFLGIMREI